MGPLLVLHLSALPQQYTAHIAWAECGNVGTCQKPEDHRIVSTDGSTIQALKVTSTSTGEVFHQVLTKEEKYQWDDGQHDCASDGNTYPIQTDWAWLNYSTTTGPTMVPCVTDASRMCQLFSGPWPEQITSNVQLWINPDGVPDSLVMECALFPFTIFKNYTNIVEGPPNPAALTIDESCNKPPAPTKHSRHVPFTKAEAVVRGSLGPYTRLLQRHMAAHNYVISKRLY